MTIRAIAYTDIMKSVTALVLLLVCATGSADTDASRDQAIAMAERFAATLVGAEKIPGLSVAVVISGRRVWAESFGLANIEQATPVQNDTRFRIGSISKSLTATAVALLVEDKKLGLDEPISHYSTLFAGKGDNISARQLLLHRSGIPHYAGDDFVQHTQYDSMTDAMDKYWDKPLLFTPGSRFGYSSFGFNLIGAVIEQLTNMTYVDFVERRITRPLNLASMVPDRIDAIIPQRTAFYRRDKDGNLLNAPAVNNSDLWPGGGYLSSATDLARFGDAVINGDFLSPDTLTTLLDASENAKDASSPGYALGWNTGEVNGMRWIGHTGSHYGCMANLRVYPDAGMAVVTLANINIEQYPGDGTVDGFYALADDIAGLFTGTE